MIIKKGKEKIKKLKENGSTIKKAYGLIWKADHAYPFLLFVKSAIASLTPLFCAVILSLLLNELVNNKRSHVCGILVFLFILGNVCFRMIGSFLNWKCSSKFMRVQDTFIIENSGKAMRMDYSATEDQVVLDLYSNAWKANIASGTILECASGIVGALFQLLGCVTIILGVHPLFFFFLILIALVSYFFDQKISKIAQDYTLKCTPINRNADYFMGLMMDAGSGKDIRLYFPENFFSKKLFQFQSERFELESKMEKKTFSYSGVQFFLQAAQTAVLYIYLSIKFLAGHIEIGGFSLTTSSIALFSQSLRNISKGLDGISRQNEYLSMLDEFHKLPEKMNQEGKNKLENLVPLEFSFQDVWFRYPEANDYALKGVNLTIEPEETLCIVGENGSGKTTFVKLLLRLYEPERGKILLNGKEIQTYEYTEYLSLFAPIFQDYQLFSYTIRENLVFENKNLSDEKIRKCLEQMDLWEQINSLPEKLDTYLGKGFEETGVNLSGGQMQKLAIVRAFLKEGRCLLMDEPAASLDAIAEASLYEEVRKFSTKKCTVFITHRMSSARLSNKIAFFEDGKVKEYGTFSELMEKQKGFYEFYQLQAKYYQANGSLKG